MKKYLLALLFATSFSLIACSNAAESSKKTHQESEIATKSFIVVEEGF